MTKITLALLLAATLTGCAAGSRGLEDAVVGDLVFQEGRLQRQIAAYRETCQASSGTGTECDLFRESLSRSEAVVLARNTPTKRLILRITALVPGLGWLFSR